MGDAVDAICVLFSFIQVSMKVEVCEKQQLCENKLPASSNSSSVMEVYTSKRHYSGQERRSALFGRQFIEGWHQTALGVRCVSFHCAGIE